MSWILVLVPLTKAEIAQRCQMPGYPALFGNRHYGDNYEVSYEMENLTCALHFPLSFSLASWRAFVIDPRTEEENKAETARCQTLIKWTDDPSAEGNKTLEMSIPRPLINHSYYLLYEPKK